MTSYKSTRALESDTYGTSGSIRPTLRKASSSTASHNSVNISVNNTSASFIRAQPSSIPKTPSVSPSSSPSYPHTRRRDSTNSALIDDPLTHPHAVSRTPIAMLSTSSVREQSLALGHREQRHSFEPASSSSWTTATETPLDGIPSLSLYPKSPPSLDSTQLNAHHSRHHEQHHQPQQQQHNHMGVRLQNILRQGNNSKGLPSNLTLLLNPSDQNTDTEIEPAGGREEVTSNERLPDSAEPSSSILRQIPARPSRSISFSLPVSDNGEGSTSIYGVGTVPIETDSDEYDDAAIEHMLATNSSTRSWPIARIRRFLGDRLPTLLRKPNGDVLERNSLIPSLQHSNVDYESTGHRPESISNLSERGLWSKIRKSKLSKKNLVRKCLLEPLGYVPAVVLGLLLNLLDAVSYGMIIFPHNKTPFQGLAPDGISIFFVSCVVSQLVYSLGGSAFKGGNGSMMIEVVPFLHLIAETVVDRVGAENKSDVLATTVLAYALSTVMTGIVFMALGYFKLGSLIAFFPRHILVGCIGGVGWFLIITGLEVSSRMTSGLKYSLGTLKFLFLDHHVFALWFSAFALALSLRVLQYKIKHPFLVPVFFLIIPSVFYSIVAIFGLEWDDLRKLGWVFPMPEGKNIPGWRFYTFFDFSKTHWTAILDTVPAMLALTFFGILHVPINVPALGVSTGLDNVDINRELAAHGWSNFLSGGAGSVQNYLVYTNSLLFIKSGGDSRVAGVMLALGTLIIFFIGPWIVGYIPVMVVGSLIFHLGLDLVKEALWDTWGLVHRLEYLTIALIVVAMAAFGFVEGIFLGIILACVFFVVTYSRKESVRYSCTGESAKSTVRRVYRQQKFLRQVGRQIYIFKLQGDMFFGTISKVEDEVRDVFSRRRWEVNPIKFLVLDFTLVRGVDFSAAEGFGRMRRFVRSKGVCLILAGLDEEGDIGKSLRMVGVWGAGAGAGLGEGHRQSRTFDQDGFRTQIFSTLSEALEYCENCLLEIYYRTMETAIEQVKGKRLQERAQNGHESPTHSPDAEAIHNIATEDLLQSPRMTHLLEAARDTLQIRNRSVPPVANLEQPIPTLLTAFQETRENPTDFFLRLSAYFTRRTVLAGTILWRQGGSSSDGIYLIEEGTLRSVQEFQDNGLIRRTVEVILPGTISGELGLFTGSQRSSTLVCETDGVVWNFSQDRFEQMIKDDAVLAVEFMRDAMSYSAERLNTMSLYAFNLS